MKTESFRGKDFITLLEWTREEVETILDVALDLKRRYAMREPHACAPATRLRPA